MSGVADAARADPSGEAFSNRVLTLFTAQVITAGLGVFNGFFLARLIGPSQKGDYYLLTLIPSTLMVLCQLGLPQAFSFFAARDKTRDMVRRTLVLTAVVALPVMALMLVVVPTLAAGALDGVAPWLIVLVIVSFPLLLNATFTTGIVVGRQASRWMALTNIGVSLTATPLIVLLVGVLGAGLSGAIIAYALTTTVLAAGFMLGAHRLTGAIQRAGTTPYRALLKYGLPFYPTSLTQYFANRVDVYLLAWLVVDPSAPLGYYSMAVGLAELVFFFPNAVSTLFFPHVAGSSREDSDRQVTLVSRVTLLTTAAVGVALIPAATVVIVVILPAFTQSLPALYLLLPGVVALSVTKVLNGYLAGLGRTGLTSAMSVTALAINVALNIYFIPRYGIEGAALASLISYSVSSIMFSIIGARLAGARIFDFWIPRGSDVRYVIAATTTLIARVRRARAA